MISVTNQDDIRIFSYEIPGNILKSLLKLPTSAGTQVSPGDSQIDPSYGLPLTSKYLLTVTPSSCFFLDVCWGMIVWGQTKYTSETRRLVKVDIDDQSSLHPSTSMFFDVKCFFLSLQSKLTSFVSARVIGSIMITDIGFGSSTFYK